LPPKRSVKADTHPRAPLVPRRAGLSLSRWYHGGDFVKSTIDISARTGAPLRMSIALNAPTMAKASTATTAVVRCRLDDES